MLVAESRRGRRLVGRIDRGAELVAALAELCRARGVRAGELRVFGTVADVALHHGDARTQHAGPLTLAGAAGTVADLDGAPHVALSGALARHGDNGVEVLGGLIAAATVASVDFVVEEMADLVLRRSIDDRSGQPLIVEARAVEGAAPVEETPPHEEAGWSDVVAASQQSEAPAAAAEPLRVGDIIEHNRFGRCVVERIEGEGEIAHVRLKNGRLVRLSLDVLDLARTGDEDGRRVFKNIVPPTRM